MVGSYIISVKRQYPKGEPFSISKLLKQLATSIWALAAILIVVVGVVAGVFTATESAAIAVIYSLLVSVFIYKGLTWKGVWKALDGCIDTLSIVLILISTSSIFGYCLTQLHVPDLASSAILGLTDNKIIIFLLVDLIILLLGCIMDMSPIILITTPILLPIVSGLGMDPIQFGIIMVLNCGIGLLTPPVGAVLFIGSAVAKLKMEQVVKATLPFYLCMLVALILITFIPGISLALPNLLMPAGCSRPIAPSGTAHRYAHLRFWRFYESDSHPDHGRRPYRSAGHICPHIRKESYGDVLRIPREQNVLCGGKAGK